MYSPSVKGYLGILLQYRFSSIIITFHKMIPLQRFMSSFSNKSVDNNWRDTPLQDRNLETIYVSVFFFLKSNIPHDCTQNMCKVYSSKRKASLG